MREADPEVKMATLQCSGGHLLEARNGVFHPLTVVALKIKMEYRRRD